MANHKRRRPKHQRAGCLLCKPQKDERCKKKLRISSERKLQNEEDMGMTGFDWEDKD